MRSDTTGPTWLTGIAPDLTGRGPAHPRTAWERGRAPRSRFGGSTDPAPRFGGSVDVPHGSGEPPPYLPRTGPRSPAPARARPCSRVRPWSQGPPVAPVAARVPRTAGGHDGRMSTRVAHAPSRRAPKAQGGRRPARAAEGPA
ncbi:hypothetical protein GCM10018793_54220 [Streptomyces sulfonofaciens]|uniref:Uncharacterized protein n=1 Tax=Streptomyces sulfonofaciens TaxID=68272 RepID=A0A919GJJ2_9ACTN|nr:hypothetical protein GCM10018793_54220 [Streptomyces sulfonofaciens]